MVRQDLTLIACKDLDAFTIKAEIWVRFGDELNDTTGSIYEYSDS